MSLKILKKHFYAISGTTKDFNRFNQVFIENNNSVIEFVSLSDILNKNGKSFATEYLYLYRILDRNKASYRISED